MIKLVDTHIHLSDPEYEPIFNSLEQIINNMNIILIAVSMDKVTSEKTLQIANRLRDKVIPFVGIHPWSAKNENLDEFQAFLNKEIDKIMGIGEIGLDKKYVSDDYSYQLQKQVFNSLLQIAERYELPVSIHSRNSQSDVFEILTTYNLKSVLLHWFSGDVKDLSKAINYGYFISFGPSLVYSKKAQMLAKKALKELILTETDGPVNYNACFEGKIGLPTFLPSVIFTLSSILKMSYNEIASMIYENSKRYLLKRI
ncbi:MAG: TatD family hydrolase [Nitrososphaerales archaeon]